MKPNGLVAAAAIASQVSIPWSAQITASSLTSAMLTMRKVFSSSLAISAVRGLESSVTSSTTLR